MTPGTLDVAYVVCLSFGVTVWEHAVLSCFVVCVRVSVVVASDDDDAQQHTYAAEYAVKYLLMPAALRQEDNANDP